MRFKPTTLAVSLAAAIAALGALPSTVYAQPDPAPAPQSDADRDDAAPDRPTTLDAMNVTARRRVESAQDVPVAISAFDADDLVELQASNIDNLQGAVPNLNIVQGRGSANSVNVWRPRITAPSRARRRWRRRRT